ncbi:MAG: phosphatidylglycerophosphatase A [Parcubacteria group bacterium]|nr:phosphatidylglycerophosphatase A [Parcubacteria group bacterium]
MIKKLHFDRNFWIKFWATGGLGYYLPWEWSGIYGAFLGLGLSLFLNPLSMLLKVIISLILVIIGIPLCTRAEKLLNRGIDPAAINFDEIIGVQFSNIWFNLFQTVSIFHFNIPLWFLLIIIYGIFDVLEPFPIKRIEKLIGGWGIVIDDLMAGIYTVIILSLLL